MSGDHVEAFNHNKLASDQGHSESTFELARMQMAKAFKNMLVKQSTFTNDSLKIVTLICG
jgi:hypothetical protein